ncbi:MAG: hypothetical protein JST68_00575 [Bacteroidetes bacterium]|nr:hypothetical protein [Bacteroidota bacterium]
MRCKTFACFIVMSLLYSTGKAQEITSPPTNSIERSIGFINKKYSDLTDRLEKKSRHALEDIQRNEASLLKRLKKKDSVRAAQIQKSSEQEYARLYDRLNGSPATFSPKQYFAAVDSVHTGMQFLRSSDKLGLSASAIERAGKLEASAGKLQQQLEVSDEVQNFLRQREQLWKTQLQQTPGLSGILGINKNAFYYQQQLAGYKEMLNDKDKLEEKALDAIRNSPGFQQFWQKNSILSRLFPQPAATNGVLPPTTLQTSSQVQQIIANVMTPGADPAQLAMSDQLRDKVGDAQDQLGSLKSRLNNLESSVGGAANGGSSTMTMPDFKPNSQHNKTFLQRIETGFNLQSGPSTNLLPVTLSPSVYAGYKFSDRMTAGIGGGYIMGLGQSFRQFKVSSQGVTLRSYLDVKLKGSIWISGGFEYSYLQAFSDLQALKNVDAWRKSALIGLTKKYKIGKKEGKLQLLFDALYAQQVPKGQPLVYRIGYSF